MVLVMGRSTEFYPPWVGVGIWSRYRFFGIFKVGKYRDIGNITAASATKRCGSDAKSGPVRFYAIF